MRKSIITLLCALGVVVSTSAVAAPLTVKANAPQRYTVKKGDTLWGISGMYLRSPWKWTQLWGMNKQSVRNPHLIYPGQTLVLRYVNGEPRLSIEGSATEGNSEIKLSPTAYDVTSGYSIPTLPLPMLQSFMQYINVATDEDLQKDSTLIAGPDRHLMYVPGDRVYSRGLEQDGRYLSYRVNKKLYDPDTNQFLGYEMVYSGELQTVKSLKGGPKVNQNSREKEELQKGERYYRNTWGLEAPMEMANALEIVKVSSEIKENDLLRYVPSDSHERFNFAPHEPFAQITAKVVRIFDGISESGPYQTILLNRGELDGLEPGAVLNLYQVRKIGPKVENRDGKGVAKYIALPAEELGVAMVYMVSDHLAYAVVISATGEISVGDTAANPGWDLDDLRAENAYRSVSADQPEAK